ncbi:MAG: hypothetical protein Q8S48_13650 [Methylococcaceae bacterium]|nr:hypothetical protein [Methylococcaceae bacterium]
MVDCTESLPRCIGHAGGRAPTLGALGDAGAVAEQAVNHQSIDGLPTGESSLSSSAIHVEMIF